MFRVGRRRFKRKQTAEKDTSSTNDAAIERKRCKNEPREPHTEAGQAIQAVQASQAVDEMIAMSRSVVPKKHKWQKLQYVHVYTDGACSGNNTKHGKNAKAGYGACFVYQKRILPELSLSLRMRGSETNQTAELQAILAVLDLIVNQKIMPCLKKVVLYSDSKYCLKGIQEWLPKWRQNGYMTSAGQAVKNRQQWELMASLLDLARDVEDITLKFLYVKGHSENKFNDEADRLAKHGVLRR